MSSAFAARLNKAIESIAGAASMKCCSAATRCLYTPTYLDGRYVWIKIMDSDGTLLSERPVSHKNGEGVSPSLRVSLLLGIIIQSEDATSQSKPNPLGKAALRYVPNGVWVDTGKKGRRRLDDFVVTFVLPKGEAAARQKRFSRTRRNVLNAATVMPQAVAVEVNRGASSEKICELLKVELRPFLVGKGRPRSEI